uniref:GP161 protein n=1 Tax=Macrostomum lignano TaxID=282301 RepID=A0A1I8JQK6_9PLAT
SLFVLDPPVCWSWYAVLSTFSPGTSFPLLPAFRSQLWLSASSVALLLPLLLALAAHITAGLRWRTRPSPATLLTPWAPCCSLPGLPCSLGVAALFWPVATLLCESLKRNFQLATRLSHRLRLPGPSANGIEGCSGWNFTTTAHRSVSSAIVFCWRPLGVLWRQGWQWIGCLRPAVTQKKLPPATHQPDSGRVPRTRHSPYQADWLVQRSPPAWPWPCWPRPLLACQCAYQWRISDPDRRRQIGQERLELRRIPQDHQLLKVLRQPPKRRAPERPTAVPTVVAGKTRFVII